MMAPDNVDQAGRDAGISKFHEKVFEDQLLAHVCRLQQYRRSEDENITCSLQKEALQALYRIYSFGLRPATISETSLETLLQRQLLELMNQPCGIDGDSGKPHAVLVIEGPESPLWDLHDWSLKLTRLLIDNGHLSANTADTVETNLIKLLETIQIWQLEGPARPRTAKNIAIIAHCLCKIRKMYGPTTCTQRQLMSPNFIQNHLFPLACKFAATEYPASIMDPISYYELFESSGKLVEPDEALVEWNRRNERVDAPGNGSKRIRLDDECSDLKDDHLDPLPPAHACLEHLIYKLTVSSNRKDQDVIVMFLQRKVFEPRDKPNGDSMDGSGTGDDDGLHKLALMNKIVALHVLGRVKLQAISSEEISLLNVLVLPNLEQDCLLLKLCKFQLARFLRVDDVEQQIKLAEVFLGEFMQILDIDDCQDWRHKLFVIFASVASESLNKLWRLALLRSLDLKTSLTPLDRKSRLILVKKSTNLYLDYKIIGLLALVDLIYDRQRSEDFSNNIERLMTKVIDSIAAELLVISHASDRAQNLLEHLDSATYFRVLLLPETTVDKLIKLAKLNMLGGNHSLWQGYNLETSTYLERALRNPLRERTKSLAIDMTDRFLTEPFTNGTDKIKCATMILGNLCYHQLTNSTLSSISNNSGPGTSDLSHQYDNCNPPFESHERLSNILALCDRIERRTDLTTSWVMSILMSWPSFRVVARIEQSSKFSSIKLMWVHFVDFAIRILDKFRSHEILFEPVSFYEDDDFVRYKTRVNLLFALIAAFNHDPKRLENYLNYVIGPVGRSRSLILKYVKLWLDVIIRTGDNFTRYGPPEWGDKTFAYRSYMVISHQALINIHRAQTSGNKLGFSIKELKSKLNSARRFVLKWLADIRQQAIKIESPLENFYAHYIRQLEAIGDYK